MSSSEGVGTPHVPEILSQEELDQLLTAINEGSDSVESSEDREFGKKSLWRRIRFVVRQRRQLADEIKTRRDECDEMLKELLG